MRAIVALTDRGSKIAKRLKDSLPDTVVYLPSRLDKSEEGVILFSASLKDLTAKLFKEYSQVIFCMALGIVVRIITPYIVDKFKDPGIVVVDEEGRFAISVLSGHEGGANKLCYLVANIIDAEPVVTTSGEVSKRFIVGVGFRRDERRENIIEAIKGAVELKNVELDKVRCIATIELKRGKRELFEAADELNIPLRFVSVERVRNFSCNYNRSDFVMQKLGIYGVCEPCALLIGRRARLILPKTKIANVAVAIAEEHFI